MIPLEFYFFSLFFVSVGLAVAFFLSLLWVHSSLQLKISNLQEEYELQLSRMRGEHDAVLKEMHGIIARLSVDKGGVYLSAGSVTGSSIVGGDATTHN